MIVLWFVVIVDYSGIEIFCRVDVSFGNGNGSKMNYEDCKFYRKRS